MIAIIAHLFSEDKFNFMWCPSRLYDDGSPQLSVFTSSNEQLILYNLSPPVFCHLLTQTCFPTTTLNFNLPYVLKFLGPLYSLCIAEILTYFDIF